MPRTAPRLALCAVVLASCTAADAQFWNPWRSKPAATAKATPAPAASFKLQQQSGPWLIVATTFSGEGAESQARELATELRQTLDQPVYLHEMKFDLADNEPVGRGVDRFGAPIKMKYRSGSDRREWAVLLGDYLAVDDSAAERDLARIKSLQPRALEPDAEGRTHQNLAGYRQVAAKLFGGEAADGPMRAAFLTRNPILPAEFFVPKGVDKFVEKMNKGLDHSVLDIPGRYTVKVATFRGRGTLLGATQAKSSASRKRRDGDPALVEAAKNAHWLCNEMRAKGWEAYEFHDRTESYVTVGSFDRAEGRSEAERMKHIVRTFGAAYPTSPTPLQYGRLPTAQKQREELRQQFNTVFTSEVGQVASGYTPKYAHVADADNPKAPLLPIPFDIHPHAIEAPKRSSVSGGFAWRR